MRFEQHLTLPVMQPRVTNVHALLGKVRRELGVYRPDPYDVLKVVSHEARPSGTLLNSPLKIDGYFFDTRSYEPNNVAHLINFVIPLCRVVKRALGAAPSFIFPKLQPRFRELLVQFGIHAVSTKKPVAGRKVQVFVSRNLDWYDICGTLDPIVSFFEGTYDASPEVASRKLFLSRKDSRSLLNEAEVRASVEARGYETIYMEEHSIADQVRIAQSATDVVAIHGAAMGYLTLCPTLNSVIELLPNHVGTGVFPIAFGWKAESYWQLLAEYSEDVQFAGWSSIVHHKQMPFAVDLNQLETALGAV